MDIRTISGAAYSRPPVSVASAADTTARLDGSKGSGQSVPYLSPVYRFDPIAQLSILSFRDTMSGDVTTQIPSEKVVAQYRRNRGEAQATEAQGPGKLRTSTAETASPATAAAPDGADGAPKLDTAPGATAAPVAGSSVAPVSAASTAPEAVAASGATTELQRVSLKV